MRKKTGSIAVVTMIVSFIFAVPAYAEAPKESAAALISELGEGVQNGWSPAVDSVKEGIEETSGQSFEELAALEAAADIRNQIVTFAKQFVGRPYVYGGSSLTNGTDCSGFTMRVMEQFGIQLGRDSRSQAASVRRIPVESVQPGDLVFYASGRSINHVALYIGNGQIVHASNERTGITISSMYYRAPYLAGTVL